LTPDSPHTCEGLTPPDYKATSYVHLQNAFVEAQYKAVSRLVSKYLHSSYTSARHSCIFLKVVGTCIYTYIQ